ncbi:MAG: methyltransferase [Pyrinomonadaceae bacterium]|nr:methyltransferase [Pyrinomonadaceae bacterium]
METAKQQEELNPSKIMQVGMGFWASKTLLSAVNMSLFTHLAEGDMTGDEIKSKLGLHERSLYDFLDTLVALGFLEREGLKETSVYSNTPETDLFLDENKPTFVGGMLKMANNRLFRYWNDLEEGLRTGLPQNETKHGGKMIFDALYEDPEKLLEFVNAMAGISMANFAAFAEKFDFNGVETVCDVGGAGGHLSMQIVTKNDGVNCTTFDLPGVCEVAEENIKNWGLTDRIKTQPGDFFTDEFPKADVVTMGMILHDWGLDEKKMLMRKAFDALPDGGALVAIENIIDDNRSENAFGLMMSLNMLIEFDKAFDFSGADFTEWAKEIGFRETSVMHLAGPASAAIAIK